MSSYSRERKVLRLTRAETDALLVGDRTRLRTDAPMALTVRYRQADVVVSGGRILKARRPWDAIGGRVPHGHGDVKVAIERAVRP